MPTSSLGVYGPSQTQAVTVLKAMLPDNFLEVRKQRFKGNHNDCYGAFKSTESAITDVLPHELVFVERTFRPSRDTSAMETFVADHPPYGRKFLTGGIQLEAFSAFNGLWADDSIHDRIAFAGAMRICHMIQCLQALRHHHRLSPMASLDLLCKQAARSQSKIWAARLSAPVTGYSGCYQQRKTIDRSTLYLAIRPRKCWQTFDPTRTTFCAKKWMQEPARVFPHLAAASLAEH